MSELEVCVAFRSSYCGGFASLEEFTKYVVDNCLRPEKVGETYVCGECEDSGFFIDYVLNGAVPTEGFVEVGESEIDAIEEALTSDLSEELFESFDPPAFVVYFK